MVFFLFYGLWIKVLSPMTAQYIADTILKINEKGLWRDPPPEDPAARAKQDEEIFQTARLIKFVFILFFPYRSWGSNGVL